MSIQDSVAGSRETLQRRPAKAYPVPIGDMAHRRSSPERESAFSGVIVGPWGATPVVETEGRLSQAVRGVDRVALGLMYGAVFALWPFAVCFLLGLV